MTVTVTATATDTMTMSGTATESGTESDSTGSGSMSNSNSGTATDTATDTATETATDTATETATDSDTNGETDTQGPLCGNGIVDADEICDDGVNDGGYGSCSGDCQEQGPHCGDGILDDGAEICDDGNMMDGDLCDNDCGASQCAEIKVLLEPLTPNIVMVLDKSGSMIVNSWDHDEDANTPEITRWASLYGVVDEILSNFQDKLNFGVSLFPSKNATQTYNSMACVVEAAPEVAVAESNKNAILAAIPAAMSQSIFGGTPASSGMATAVTHLKTLDAKFPRAVLLVTDGAANCDPGANNNSERFEIYDQGLHTVVQSAWNDDQIPTYVVGIDISKQNTGNKTDGNPNNIVPYDKLNELAVDGGKPQAGVDKFYATKNQNDLQAALDQIAEDALSCIVVLDDPPVFPQNTKVKIEGQLVPPVMDCSMEDGWVYTDEMYSGIELCGTWCDTLKIKGEIDVEYFCKPG